MNQPRDTQKNTSNTAIFYNVFVPPPGDSIGPRNALRIIQEQLEQLQNSYVRDAPVYYTLIGYNQTRHVFDGPNFHLLQYIEEGSEELTLQALWGYCLQHPTHRVSYIHDKGSFHQNAGNEIRRAYATKSALSEACHTMTHNRCNVCVFDFYLTPYHHGGANMWTADCNYVRKLLPPMEFDTHMKRMYASIPPESPLKPQDFGENALSIGRFAMEHWVFSHPHVRPCETLGKNFSYHKVRLLGPVDWEPQLGRRIHNVRFYGIFKEPWYTKEGRLYQYEYLYGEKPPLGSWFWPIYNKHKLLASDNTTMTENHEGQRVVILLGPVKSIFNDLISLKKKEKLGYNWTLVGKQSLQPSVRAILVNNDDTIPIRNTSTFLKIQHAWDHGRNILLGAEPLLDSLVMSSYQSLSNIFPQNAIVDVNIMYQTPRSSHLISVYKDAMAATWTFPLKQKSLSEWLCHGDLLEKIVTAQLNPMGVANTFVRHGNAIVTIGDESGMEDVLGTVACEVLHVLPCNDTEMNNKHRKSAVPPPPEIKNEHLVKIETILRRMDCFYYCRLRGNLTILHKKDVMFSETEGWNKCCAASPEEVSLSPSAAYTALKNLGCLASNEKKAAITKDIPAKAITSQVKPAKKATSQVKKVKAPVTKDIPAKEVISQVNLAKKTTSQIKKVKQDPPLGVLVLGMHRSGTSLLAGLLVEGFGYTVGGPLLRASGENSKGYYERRDVVLENMHLLKQQGAHWNRAVEKYNASIPLVLGDKGKKALQFMENLKNTPWLVKDPRFCITLPTWHIQPAIVFTYRHPMQVAFSLEERFLTLERGLELWIIYNKLAIQNSQQLCRVLSSNDAILANPLEESTRIVEELVQKCHLQRPSRNVTREIVDRFVDASLQHHTKDDACQNYDSSEKGEMYKKAMKVYCDLQSGKAYKPDYEWPI